MRPQPRFDLDLIADLIPAKARLLDVGCGEGAWLHRLVSEKQVDGRGMELGRQGVNACVAKGLSVIQGDADTDLADYPGGAFDYVVLSDTIQIVRRPDRVLDHLLRIARRAVISFPNFGHWPVRLDLALRGRMPRSGVLPYYWYETPNIHLCTIKDFVALTAGKTIRVEQFLALDAKGRLLKFSRPGRWANLFAAQAIFVLARAQAASCRPATFPTMGR